MRLNPIIQKEEIYICSNCNQTFSFLDVYNNWKCPICNQFITIKVIINDFFHSCNRVNPNELLVGELVTLENKFIHEILNTEKYKATTRLALKEYTVIEIENDSFITKIIGGWYY